MSVGCPSDRKKSVAASAPRQSVSASRGSWLRTVTGVEEQAIDPIEADRDASVAPADGPAAISVASWVASSGKRSVAVAGPVRTSSALGRLKAAMFTVRRSPRWMIGMPLPPWKQVPALGEQPEAGMAPSRSPATELAPLARPQTPPRSSTAAASWKTAMFEREASMLVYRYSISDSQAYNLRELPGGGGPVRDTVLRNGLELLGGERQQGQTAVEPQGEFDVELRDLARCVTQQTSSDPR